MLGLGIYLSQVIRQTYTEDLEQRLADAASLISDSAAPALAAQDTLELNALARRYADLVGMRVTVIATDGTVLGESDENWSQMDNHLDRPEVAQALESGSGSSTRFSHTVGQQMLYVAARVMPGGQALGVVRVALPLAQVEANVAHLQRIIVYATLLSAGLVILLAALIAAYTTRPLRSLTVSVEKVMSTGFHNPEWGAQLVPHSTDEVGKLTRAFKRLGVQIQAQLDALETEQEKLTCVLQEMTDGVLIVDNTGKVQMLNRTAQTMFSVPPGNAGGESLVETLRNHQVYELWQFCLKTGETQSAILEFGEKRLWLQCIATPMSQAHQGNVLILLQNITRLRQADTVRRDFISNISHELRTPLASLKALTETLQEGALDDPPAARRFLTRMETEVDALSLMVSELLELARIESGQVPLQLKAIRPIDLLLPAVERLRLQAERGGLDLETDCPENLPLVLADQTRLEQVLVNLLHNAIKFTPSGGKITLRAWEQADKVIFSVQDTGQGISETDLPRIFERFYKTDQARSGGGTGLGLSIARHLVEAHGGKLWAESIAGQGSTFFFSVPRS
jgi:two-component system phosphate regulon sensor histidine kinase PhoR